MNINEWRTHLRNLKRMRNEYERLNLNYKRPKLDGEIDRIELYVTKLEKDHVEPVVREIKPSLEMLIKQAIEEVEKINQGELSSDNLRRRTGLQNKIGILNRKRQNRLLNQPELGRGELFPVVSIVGNRTKGVY